MSVADLIPRSGTIPRPMRARRFHAPSARGRRLIGVAVASLALVGALWGCESRESGESGPLDPTLVFGEVGRSPGQLTYPRATAACPPLDPEGSPLLFVIDKSARVQAFDARTGLFVGGFRTPELELGKPTGMTVAPHPVDPGRLALYVADTHYFRVLVYPVPDSLGPDPAAPLEPEFAFGEYGTGDGQFVYVTDVAVLRDARGAAQRIYVGEYGGNDRVSAFDVRVRDDGSASFEFAFAFGVQGVAGESPEPVFRRPQSLAIDHAARELVLTDSGNHRVGRFTLEGEPVAWIGSPDAASREPGSFIFPYGLALLEDRTALVSEFENARVQRIDLETGECLGQWGEPGRRAGQLSRPWSVEVIGETAYVLDSDNDRVQAFRAPAPGVAR